MKITLRQLEVFVAVATHGGVTRAAGNVALTQAAASMALADLERQLGVPLFDRLGRELRLNEHGRLLLERARDVLARARDLEHLAQAGAAGFELHLGASVTIGNHLLPPLIARMKRSFPQAKIHFSRFNSEQVLAQLRGLRIDIGFVEGVAADDGEILRYPWQQDSLQFFAAPGHPLAGRSFAPTALEAFDWIVRERGSGTRAVMEQACRLQGVVPQVAFELEQPEAIRQCVRAGLGIGCLSQLELADAFAAGSLVPLAAAGLEMPRQLEIVLHRRKYIGQGLAAVLRECGIDVDAMH